MDTQITLRIKNETRKLLKEIANTREVSESDIVREAIREKIASFFRNKSKAFNCVCRKLTTKGHK